VKRNIIFVKLETDLTHTYIMVSILRNAIENKGNGHK